MDRDRLLRRAGLMLGGVALSIQLWTALAFVRALILSWSRTQPELVSFAETVNRFSQLKTPALKYPEVLIYVVLFFVGILGILGSLTVRGIREAVTRSTSDPEESRESN